MHSLCSQLGKANGCQRLSLPNSRDGGSSLVTAPRGSSHAQVLAALGHANPPISHPVPLNYCGLGTAELGYLSPIAFFWFTFGF